MKLMKVIFAVLLSMSAFSHDEGHGPALKDESLHGGKISAIIKSNEVSKGRKANMLYKGELVHSSNDLKVKLYLFDKKMNALKLGTLSKEVEAVQIERGKEKSFKLVLNQSGKYYEGMRPKNKRVPFNIDVKVMNGKTELFGAFDGLD